MRLISSELGEKLAGGRIDHLEADHFGRLQVGASLKAGEFGAADRRQDHAEEGLTDAWNPTKQQVAGIDLTLCLLVVGGGNLGQEHHVSQGLFPVVSDQSLGPFGHDGFVEVDGVLKVGIHGRRATRLALDAALALDDNPCGAQASGSRRGCRVQDLDPIGKTGVFPRMPGCGRRMAVSDVDLRLWLGRAGSYARPFLYFVRSR